MIQTKPPERKRILKHEIFTFGWAQAWAGHLNRNPLYRSAAQKWEWPLILILEKDPAHGVKENREIYLDLWHGECREARLAVGKDLQEAPYIISAPLPVWQEILAGQADPMMALTRGRLKLRKGNLLKLARFAQAAKQLVLSAVQVGSAFPVDRPEALPESSPAAPPESTPARPHRFATTSAGGLRHDILPMRLYHKAKKLGIWNPRDIDLQRDQADWQTLNDLEKEVLLHLTALFQGGEEAVTLDLLPLIMVIAKEGRIEEELYLTTFLWEEAKHTEFFRRFLDEVALDHSDLTRFHGPAYRRIFYESLPAAMNALLSDPSPAAQARASATYNMIVEGTLAETGYHAYYAMLERNDLLPGLREGIAYLKRDESRHIAYGIYLLSRLVAREPALWPVLENDMAIMLEHALATITELFDTYEVVPFGLKLEDFLEYALDQFNKRMNRIESARFLQPEAVEIQAGDD